VKLVTFQNAAHELRVGALAPDGRIVDLNAANELYQPKHGGRGADLATADELVPT